MNKKGTKRAAKKKVGGPSDLAPQAGRAHAVKGGAFNAFANFGDIKGESTDKDHKDWVTILKYDHA
jgi:hypothetical protein